MSHRRQQLESTLKRAIAKVLSTGLADPRISGLISVTSVEVSPDLRNATVKVSILPETKQRTTFHGLRHAARHIQSLVGKELRTRTLPHLDFQLDESLKKQAQVLGAIREAMEQTPRETGQEPGQGPEADPDTNSPSGTSEDRQS
jgi:ribosome-binding factor A